MKFKSILGYIEVQGQAQIQETVEEAGGGGRGEGGGESNWITYENDALGRPMGNPRSVKFILLHKHLTKYSTVSSCLGWMGL